MRGVLLDVPDDIEIKSPRDESREKMPFYAQLGVPEAWRYDGKTIRVYQLGSDGRYAPQTASRVLTGFPIAEAQRVLSQVGTASETALVKSFRRWVRTNARP
jgi:hypothetical protein